MAPVRERARARAAGVEAPNRVTSPAVGWDWPEMRRMRVVLPAPVAAHQPENLPLFHGQGGVIQGQSVAVPAGQVPGL